MINIKEIETLLVSYVNEDEDFKDIYSYYSNNDNVINLKIVKLDNIEHIFHLFRNTLYYFLRSVDLFDTLDINFDDVEISKQDLHIRNKLDGNVLIKIDIKIF